MRVVVLLLLLIIPFETEAINLRRISVFSDTTGERAGIKIPLGIDKLALAIQPPYKTISEKRDNYSIGLSELPVPFLGDVQISYYHTEQPDFHHNGVVIEKFVLYKLARNIEAGININVFRYETIRTESQAAVLDAFRPMIQVKLFAF